MGMSFESDKEFRTVMDRTFSMMDSDPEMGPKLRDADVPQQFTFTDVDLVLNIRAAAAGEDGNLVWDWTDDPDFKPKVKMTMSSQTANRYFQGKENMVMAIARRRIKTGGDIKAALALIPITEPIFAQYREMLAQEYPHLLVS
jgi:SCP-2 sterol transfer family